MTRPHALRQLQELDKQFRLTQSHNAEVTHAWFRLAIASGNPGR